MEAPPAPGSAKPATPFRTSIETPRRSRRPSSKGATAAAPAAQAAARSDWPITSLASARIVERGLAAGATPGTRTIDIDDAGSDMRAIAPGSPEPVACRDTAARQFLPA